jgi:diguanylate cyclase (GGDEF)-like protein
MVEGNGPRVAPTSAEVPAYASAPIAQEMDIGAYMGVPLNNAAGALFGTLCAIDPKPQPAELIAGEAELELFGRLLSTVLVSDLRVEQMRREVERAAVEAIGDGLTGIGNRRYWESSLAREEVRCQRYGHPAAVIIVDLDGLKAVNDSAGHAAGDQLLQRSADAMRAIVRPVDALARIGGDEFAILAVECPPAEGERLAERVREGLAAAGVAASVGWAERDPRKGLPDATVAADAAMYADKKRRRAGS